MLNITETGFAIEAANAAHPSIPAGATITCIKPDLLDRDLRPGDLILAVSEAIDRHAPWTCTVREIIADPRRRLLAIVKDPRTEDEPLLADPEPLHELIVLGIVETIKLDLEFDAAA